MSTSHASNPVIQPHGALHRIPRARMYETHGRPDMVRVGTIIWLASDLMFFAALFGAYFTIMNVTNAEAAATNTRSLWDTMTEHLDWRFAFVNTLILVLSSVTCQIGVFRAEDGQAGRTGSLLDVRKWGLREWYTLSFVMGAMFIGGQVWEYSNLISEGITISANAYASAFFLATGFHGLHVTAGLIAFLLVMGRTLLARTFTHEQAVAAHAVSYYWHFVDVVWVALFSVIYGPSAVHGVQQMMGMA